MPVLVLFFLSGSSLGLVGVDHSGIGTADCLLLHVFDIDSGLFVILADYCLYLPGSHFPVVVQSALRLGLVQGLEAFVGILAG